MTYPIVTAKALVLVLAISTVHCASFKKAAEEPDVDPDTITDVQSVVDYLQKNHVSLIHDGPFSSPEMTTPGHAFTPTSGGKLYVFKYRTGADALGALTWLNDEGDAGRYAEQVYRKEDLVVVYQGDDPRIERALVRVFGSRTR